jgi:hypothetical protein
MIGNARARTLFTKTEFESNNASSSRSMATTKSESLTVGSFVINYLLSLVNMTTQTDVLFSCATPDFQKKLKAIAAAGTITDWQKGHNAFVSTYGHGFVSTLKLISCATGELTATDESQAARRRAGGDGQHIGLQGTVGATLQSLLSPSGSGRSSAADKFTGAPC